MAARKALAETRRKLVGDRAPLEAS
jgi:hypothetical protein